MTAQTILPANSVVDSGFNVANSLRFNREMKLFRCLLVEHQLVTRKQKGFQFLVKRVLK